MKSKTFFLVLALLLAFIVVSCTLSEISWVLKESKTDSLRQTVGLPSLAIGNLNPSTRNPGVELFCTGLNDVPGGYCYYFSTGIPYDNFTLISNYTVIKGFSESGK